MGEAGTRGDTDAPRLLEAAEAHYAGDFLADEPYADWAVPLREQAHAVHLSVLRTLAQAAADNDDHDVATRSLLRLLGCDPYDEPAHLCLVELLSAAGRHGEARRRYRHYLERMAELDVEPAAYPRR